MADEPTDAELREVALAFDITDADLAALSDNDRERMRLFLARPSFKPLREQGDAMRRMLRNLKQEKNKNG